MKEVSKARTDGISAPQFLIEWHTFSFGQTLYEPKSLDSRVTIPWVTKQQSQMRLKSVRFRWR